jgi:hypothetical protein
MIGATTVWLTVGAGLFGAVFAAGFLVGVVLVGVVLVGVVLVGVVLVEVLVVLAVVVVDVVVEEEVVVVVVVAPPPGAAAPPVEESASAAGAHRASIARASARFGSVCLGEVIEMMPVGAPQMSWNTPESVTSR